MENKMPPEFWDFVRENALADPSQLRMKYRGKDDIDYPLAITQIEARRRHGSKFRETLAHNPEFIFADSLAAEQATGDALANVHAAILGDTPGRVVDFTAGLGNDIMHIARNSKDVLAVEMDANRAEALVYNSGVKVLCGDSTELLAQGRLQGDVAFIDPARRDDSNGRLFAIEQCQPDVLALLPLLRKNFSKLVLKLSPMLDVKMVLRQLGREVTDIYAIGTRTECKEVFVVMKLGKDFPEPLVHALTYTHDGVFDLAFTDKEEGQMPLPQMGIPAVGDTVYEPWPAVQKAGGMRVFAAKFGLDKIAPNTNVFYGKHFDKAVMGSGHMLERVIPWQSKYLKRLKKEYPALDVAVRNFGMTAEALRKKLEVRPAESPRLLGVTDARDTRWMLLLK